MTPKPDNLPAPADMTLAQLLREMARILHNAGGEAHGAGYSAKLADEAIKRAENLPGWKPIETAPYERQALTRWPGSKMWNPVILIDTKNDGQNLGKRDDWWHSKPDQQPTHWYDFGNGSPMPPAPVEGVGNEQ